LHYLSKPASLPSLLAPLFPAPAVGGVETLDQHLTLLEDS
jgi:hypothetical protein